MRISIIRWRSMTDPRPEVGRPVLVVNKGMFYTAAWRCESGPLSTSLGWFCYVTGIRIRNVSAWAYLTNYLVTE